MDWLIFLFIWVLTGVAVFCAWGWWRATWEVEKNETSDEKVFKRARHKALKIVREARDRAVEIINDAGSVASNQDAWLDGQVRKATEEKLAGYREMLSKLYEEVKQKAGQEMGEFESAIEKGAVEAEKAVAEKMKMDYDQANAQVEEYRTLKMKQVEEQAQRVMGEVVKRVVGRAIPLQEHKLLIREAIEEARRENVL